MTDKEIIQVLRICATHIEKGCGLCPQMKYVRCTERLAYLQPENLRYAEGTDRISHLEKMQIMQQKWVRKHSLYL